MKQSINPVRWSEQHDSALPEELIRGLKGYAQQGPSGAQRVRMAERLATDIAMDAQPSSISNASGVWLRWGAGAVLLAGLGGLGALLHSGSAPRQERALVTVDAPPMPSSITAAPTTSAVSEPAQAVVQREAAPQAAKRRVGRAKPASGQVALERVDPGAELRLLAPARQLLAAQPTRALELANEHARRFPRGIFVEEREVLTIEALARTGKRAQAEREARSFAMRYPQSSYLERVSQALDEPTP